MAKLGKRKKKQEETDNVAHLKNQLARALADYDNQTKRFERQSEMIAVRAKTQFMTGLLPAIDMLYDAFTHLGEQGLAITIQTLESSLRDQGIEKIIPEVGSVFEESMHEAIEALHDDTKGNGEIVEVSLVGWRMGDTIIRPAKVKVNINETKK